MVFKLTSHRTQTKVMLTFITLVMVISVSYLVVKAVYDPRIPFLKTDANANWILYPFSSNIALRRNNFIGLITEFTKDFELAAKPSSKVYLYLKGFKEYSLWINDNQLSVNSAEMVNWKKAYALEISQFLKEGTNTIRVDVANKYGPPALWLYSRGLQDDIKTDVTWSTSVLGSPAVAAGLANDCFLHPISLQGIRPFDALSKKLLILVLFFFISSVVFLLYSYGQRIIKPDSHPSLRFLTFTPGCILMVCITVWMIVFINNAPKIPLDSMGFDADAHLYYVEYILNNRSIPLANEGWQTHQPPLFYLVSALVMSLSRMFFAESRALYSLKLIPFLCGVGQICLAYFAARMVFPNSKAKQSLSVVITALIPMNIYISSYLSNETLSAFLISLAIFITILILNSNYHSPKLYCVLGLVIGLAILTKITALTVLPVVFLVLLYKLFSEEKCSITRLGKGLGLMFLVIIVVAGWFYARNWMHFGKIFVTGWDYSLVSPWWQDPGFHTYKYFCQFGKVFTVPYFAGTYSLFDSLYSTFWGDAFFGGRSAYMSRPPWNYEYVSAVYILAIPATLAILIGMVCAIGHMIRAADKVWLLMLGSLFAVAHSIVYLNLRFSYYCHAKAFYSLGVILPIGLVFAFGLGYLDNWLKDKKLSFLRVVLYGWFGTLILAVLLSLFVRPSQVYGEPDLGALASQGKLSQAVGYYTQLLNDNPDDWYVYEKLAETYILQNKYDEAIKHYEKALQLRPDWPEMLCNFAEAILSKPSATQADKRRAVEYAELACRLTGYRQVYIVLSLVSTYDATEQSEQVVVTAEKAIELAASSGQWDLVEKTQKRLQMYKLQHVYSEPLPSEDDVKP
jgi:hypothetical protein